MTLDATVAGYRHVQREGDTASPHLHSAKKTTADQAVA